MRSRPAVVVVALASHLVVSVPARGADDDPTRDLVTAPRVRRVMVLKMAGSTTKDQTGAAFAYSTGNGEFRPLVSGSTFAASGAMIVAFRRVNPLELQVTASETEADDPNHTQLVQAMEKLIALPKGLPQSFEQPQESCTEATRIARRLSDLKSVLREGLKTAEHLDAWRATLGANPGAAAARDVRAKVKAFEATVRASAKKAEEAIQAIERETVSPTPSPSPSPAAAPPGPSPSPAPADQPKPPEPVPQAPAPAPPPPAAPPATIPPAARSGLTCRDQEWVMRQVQGAVLLANPAHQLAQLRALADALKDLQTALEPYADDDNWDGDAYVIRVTTAAPEKIKTVEVKAVKVTYAYTDDTLRVETAKPSSVQFRVRRASSLVPEVAAGLVVAAVRTPVYGTTRQADGTQVVSLSTRKTVSYSGAVLLNGVCRCGMDSFAYPMIQIGVAAGGDAPAILTGLGLRFTRPKRLALSVGGILAWVKDLDKLRVGGPVSGTAEIEADLKAQPTVKGYFALQYTF
jgi:hypothetical protein